MAEAVRFELTKGFPLPVFKTGAFNHSATPPLAERAGFEPAVGGYPTHAFQACDLNHSSISPEARILAEAFGIDKPAMIRYAPCKYVALCE